MLGTVTERSAAAAEIFEISPIRLSVTRLGMMFRMFDRVYYNRLHLSFRSSAPAITPGTARFYVETDPHAIHHLTDPIGFMDNYGAVATSVYRNVDFDVPLLPRQFRDAMYTGLAGDAKFWCPAMVYALATGTNESQGTEVGQLYLDYDITFMLPSQPRLMPFVDVDRFTCVGGAYDGAVGQMYDMDAYFSVGDSGGTITMESGEKYYCYYDPDTSTATLESKGREVPKGARCTFQPPTASYNDTTDDVAPVTSSSVLGTLKGIGDRFLSVTATVGQVIKVTNVVLGIASLLV
jgi:hypothetical protein